jgi:hypothetical protein
MGWPSVTFRPKNKRRRLPAWVPVAETSNLDASSLDDRSLKRVSRFNEPLPATVDGNADATNGWRLNQQCIIVVMASDNHEHLFFTAKIRSIRGLEKREERRRHAMREIGEQISDFPKRQLFFHVTTQTRTAWFPRV